MHIVQVCSLLVASLSLSAGKSPEDEITRNIINAVNNYVEDHVLANLRLPNIDPSPIFPLILTDGSVGAFDTLYLQAHPDVFQRRNSDGSTTYHFDVRSGLIDLRLRYNFHIKIARYIRQSGNFTLRSFLNSLQTTGIVIVQEDGSCDTILYNLRVVNFADFDLKVSPYNIPLLDEISESILNFVYPKYLPMINLALEGVVLSPLLQRKFSELVCDQISNYSPAPTTPESTTLEPTSAEPTTAEPTSAEPTTAEPTSSEPTTPEPTSAAPTTEEPTSSEPSSAEPTTEEPTSSEPTTPESTSLESTTPAPTTPELITS